MNAKNPKRATKVSKGALVCFAKTGDKMLAVLCLTPAMQRGEQICKKRNR